MDQNIIECGGFYFIHNFDSGNLGHVERVPTELIAPAVNTKTNASETPDYEFNLWTRPDCAGTEFENGNRTWFYFGIQASTANVLVRLNLINLNKQGKMYNQGMAPVTRTLPGKPQWERIRDRPVHSTDDNTFSLSFKYRTSDNLKATTFFAFTYPYSFAELQIALNSIDLKMLPIPPIQSPDDIYYCRECLIYSLEGRRVDLLTISSHHGITTVREDRLKNLFPDNQERPFKFDDKKVIFISARVHPGETPSSFVFNGFLNLLLTRNDPVAIQLRKLYVFKLIPFLNPDGVARGQYRTDTRGVNLNRVYLNPSLTLHPTVYASRALIRYYHFGCEKEDTLDDTKSVASRSIINITESSEVIDSKKKKSYKDTYYKREKTKSAKSTKAVETKKDKSGDTTNLADQVYDMKLHEMPSQTMESSYKQTSSSNTGESASILNDSALRACLDSNVHISTSEELNIPNNPLRPLRDALKNSISLLMESSGNPTTESSMCGAESRMSNVKMGWCRECRRSIDKLEDSMPGIRGMVPGYSIMRSGSPSNPPSPTHHSIDEYREFQKQQFDDTHERKLEDNEHAGNNESSIYFCTNCFKRYLITDTDEEIKLTESPSTASVAVSAGDSGDAPRGASAPPAAAGSTGDADLNDKKPAKIDKYKPPGKPVKKKPVPPAPPAKTSAYKEVESGLYLYIDLHGHASKKGIFMYGNHFPDAESSVECMLLPRIMSLNSLHFHFSSCNFTERNMYLKDRRDGMSREGSGRVAVLKATGLVRSYTLECNYNTGRLVNVLPPALRDPAPAAAAAAPLPPKYTPNIFQEVNHYRTKNHEVFEEISPFQVGRSLGASILDLTGHHPNSRIPCSEHRNLSSVREWLRAHTRTMRPQITMSRLRPKTSSPSALPHFVRSKAKVTDERKENTYIVAKVAGDTERRRSPTLLAPRSGHDVINMNIKSTSRTRYLAENEPKPKTLATKRRNILAVRKPNSTKAQAGVVKGKIGRRSADDADNSRTIVAAKLSKRSFGRTVRGATRSSNRCRAMASSSSEDIEPSWEEVAGGTLTQSSMSRVESMAGKRRPFPNHSPSQLKKIRLKTAI